MHPYVQSLIELFQANANDEQAGPMQAYMRDQFPFLGIKSPARKALMRDFWAVHGRPETVELDAILRALWGLPAREYQYVGLALLDRCRRQLGPEHAALIETLIVSKAWWDTVDGLASHTVGDLFRRFPDLRAEKISQWRAADNFWLRRTTLLFQLRYKGKTDVELLFGLVNENLGSDEFFINKAIGWALREYSKTDEAAVRKFVAATPLAPLSEREALKWLARRAAKRTPE